MSKPIEFYRQVHKLSGDGQALYAMVEKNIFDPVLGQVLSEIGVGHDTPADEIAKKLSEELAQERVSIRLALQESAIAVMPLAPSDDHPRDGQDSIILRESKMLSDRSFYQKLSEIKRSIESAIHFLLESRERKTGPKPWIEVLKEAYGCAQDGEAILFAAESGMLPGQTAYEVEPIGSDGPKNHVSIHDWLGLLGVQPQMSQDQVLRCVERGRSMARSSMDFGLMRQFDQLVESLSSLYDEVQG